MTEQPTRLAADDAYETRCSHIHSRLALSRLSGISSLAVSNLDHAPIMLLVRRSEAESTEALFAQMQEHYDARVGDSDWGPKYRIGPTFTCRDQRFAQVQTFAGSLVIQVVFDIRKGKFKRAVIFRFGPEEPLRFLSPDGSEVTLNDSDLTRSEA